MASNPRPKSQSSADSVSTDLPPHLVQQLKRMLEAELPGIRVSIDEPRTRDGEWWLDLAVENVELAVAWRPKFGFGLFEGAEYGARPSEIYREPKSTCVRIKQLVASAGHASGAQGISLPQIRQVVGMSQTQLADTLGFNQGAVSHQEKREDVLVSTLAAYVEAMGGHLEVRVRFDGFEAKLAIPRSSGT